MAIASEVIKNKRKKSISISNRPDVSTVEGLTSYAESKGYKIKKKKPNIFLRTMDYLSRPMYASAGAAKALVKGDENPLFEAWKGLKGEEKETYSDVLKEAGVENKVARGIVGFGLDVALDPTTYLGGFAIKGALKTTKLAGAGAMAATKTFNPRLAKAISVTGKSLKDALGEGFVHAYKVTPEIADDVNRYYNKIGIAKEDTIKKFHNVFEALPKEQHKQFAETLLDFRKQLPKMMKKGKITKGLSAERIVAKKELNKLTPKFKTSEQADFFKDRYTKIIDDMAESAGLPAEQRFKAYFPSIDVERLKPTSLTGRALSKTDESYANLYRGLVEKELKKPVEALTRTQMKIVRDNMAKSMLDDAVRTYGKTKEAFKKLPKEKQLEYKMIKDKQFGKEVGYLKERDFRFINDSLDPQMKVIDMLGKASGYDTFTKAFKTLVTSYFPAFHIRNAASGMIQNYQVFGAKAFDPLNLPTALGILKGSNKTVKLGKKIYSFKTLNKVMQENFGRTSRYIADLGQHIDEVTDGSYKIMSKIDPRRLGDFVEMNQKANAIVIALKQGKDMKTAVRLAERAGFNYQKITKFESKIMRRAIPFYSFMRKNAELQARTLIKHPERIINQAKLADSFSTMFGEKVTEEDLKGVPSWALDGLGFKIKDNKYVSSFGVPLEEFISRVNKPIMSTLSSLNPIIKYPLESKMGFDFFRERKIVDINKVAPASGKLLMDAQESGKMPEWLSQAINIKSYTDDEGKTKYTMSPKMLHRLRNIPTSRFQNTFEKIFDKDLDSANRFTALFTGGKIYDIDTEKQKYFTERDMRRDAEDWLLGIGEGKQLEKFYIPKND